MQYRSFVIENYRAIIGPLTVDLEKHSLIPIIGVNECGKTTILHALFCFDHFNDKLNDNGRHLRDINNLYSTTRKTPTVTAEVELTSEEFLESVNELPDEPYQKTRKLYVRRRRQVPSRLRITRNLLSLQYTIDCTALSDKEANHELASILITHLPYTLFFDDFRDSFEEKIEIVKDATGRAAGWLSIIEQLFKSADAGVSIFDLASLEIRQRKSVLAKVKKHLNKTLTQEWQNFRLDDRDALQISLEYEQEVVAPLPMGVVPKATPAPIAASPGVVKPPPPAPPSPRQYLKLEIIEKDLDDNERYFFIRDRSKGFFWFFNFVMKLEFNPKTITSDGSGSIYLLDEPGSYLHASAQSKLCQKIRALSTTNTVIYCTHSHYLLDPDSIPLSSIKVADKTAAGSVSLVSIHEHQGSITERRSAYQPVVDALQVKPFLMDMTIGRVIIAEGIYDYYALHMFRGNRNVGIIPSVNANSIRYYISLMIAWRIDYLALWDNDKAGRSEHAKAVEIFGEREAERRFFTLPSVSRGDRILQNLFDGHDLTMIKNELGLPSNSSFEKSIAALFYASNRGEILNQVSTRTRQNFEQVYSHLGL